MSAIALSAFMKAGRAGQTGAGGCMTIGAEQLLYAQDISHPHVELRQRLAAAQLTGRLPLDRYIDRLRPPDDGCDDQTYRQKPSVRRADEAQCLGDMPWSNRATAMRPDGVRNM
jgi:hypothetical protein